MKKIIFLLVVLASVLSVTGCAEKENIQETQTTANVTAVPTTVAATQPIATTVEPTTEPETTYPIGTIENPYTPGMYKVGADLPAGEYCFIANDGGSGYVCVSSDSNMDDIIENENFPFSFFVTVSDGQYLEVSRAGFVSVDNNDYTLKTEEDGSFTEGMYRVGIDIPAGEYKLTTQNGDSGYYCIYPNSVAPFDILNNDNFENSSYVTVSEGQYLITDRCIGKPVS